MTAFEIAVTVILCVWTVCMVPLWGQTVLLIDKITNRREKEKKPTSNNEVDTKK